MDDEVRNLIESQYDRAKKLLTEKRHELNLLAQTLLEKEVLHKSDLERLIGKRPFAEEEKFEHAHATEPKKEGVEEINTDVVENNEHA